MNLARCFYSVLVSYTGEQDNMWVCKSGVGEDVQGCVRQRRSESCSFCCLSGYNIIKGRDVFVLRKY